VKMKETVVLAFKTVFAERSYRIAGGVTFGIFMIVYLFTLPAEYTGAVIGPAALRYLDVRLILFAIVLSGLLALVGPMMIYAMREGQKARKATTAGSLLVSLVTPLLCCSPILPALMGTLAAILPFVSSAASLHVQKFIVVYQNELYLGAVLLLMIAVYQQARAVVACPRCRR